MKYLVFVFMVITFSLSAQPEQRISIQRNLEQATHNGQLVRNGGIPVGGITVITDNLGRQVYVKDTFFVQNDSLIRHYIQLAPPHTILKRDTILDLGSVSGSSQTLSAPNDSIEISDGNTIRRDLVIFDEISDIAGSFPLGTIIQTRGYGAPADGGGAIYEVQAAEPSHYAADGIAVIDLGTNYAVLKPQLNELKVEWFGVVGDSITNDATALQRAADFSTGQTLLFDAKDYLVNDEIAIQSFTRMQGVPGTKLWRENSAPSRWIDVRGTNGVIIDNIHFLSDKTSNFQTVIDFDESTNGLLQYCNIELLNEPIYGETMHGVLARGAYNVNIRFNKTKYCQIKLAGAGKYNKHNWVTDNYIEKPFNFGISSVTNSTADPDTIMNLYIERNMIVDPMSVGGIFIGSDGEAASPPYYVANIYIQDNIIEGLWADIADITTSIGINFRTGYVTEHIKINRNIIDNRRLDPVGNTRGIQFSNGDMARVITRDIEISGNYFGRMDLQGLVFSGADSTAAKTRSIKIIGNYFSNNRGLLIGTGEGESASGFWISQNHFDSMRTVAIEMGAHTKIDGLVISENTFTNAMAASVDAITLVTSTAEDLMGVKFTGNTIDDTYDDGFAFTNTGGAAHDILVFGNTNLADDPYIGVSPTTFDNVYSVDGTLTGERTIDLNGLGFNFYDNTFGVFPVVRIESDRTGSGASPALVLLNNDVSFYQRIDGATSLFWLGSGTNEIVKIAATAADNTLVIPSTGGFGSGIGTPTQRYQFVHTTSFNYHIESTSASGVVSLNIVNADQNWALQTEGNNSDRFVLEDVTGGTVPFIITKAAPSDAFFMAADGEVRFGAGDNGSFRTQTNGNSYVSGELNIANGTDNGAFPLQVTGASYFNGEMRIGSTTDVGTYALQVTGNEYTAGYKTFINATAPGSITDASSAWSKDVAAGQAELFAKGETGVEEQVTGLVRRVTANQNTTSTTYAAVTDLTLNVEAGKSYVIEVGIYMSSSAGGGYKITVNGTATATTILLASDRITGELDSGATITALGGDVISVSNLNPIYHVLTGLLTVNAAGTFGIQFAQVDADGGTTIISPGSFIKLTSTSN